MGTRDYGSISKIELKIMKFSNQAELDEFDKKLPYFTISKYHSNRLSIPKYTLLIFVYVDGFISDGHNEWADDYLELHKYDISNLSEFNQLELEVTIDQILQNISNEPNHFHQLNSRRNIFIDEAMKSIHELLNKTNKQNE